MLKGDTGDGNLNPGPTVDGNESMAFNNVFNKDAFDPRLLGKQVSGYRNRIVLDFSQ